MSGGQVSRVVEQAYQAAKDASRAVSISSPPRGRRLRYPSPLSLTDGEPDQAQNEKRAAEGNPGGSSAIAYLQLPTVQRFQRKRPPLEVLPASPVEQCVEMSCTLMVRRRLRRGRGGCSIDKMPDWWYRPYEEWPESARAFCRLMYIGLERAWQAGVRPTSQPQALPGDQGRRGSRP
jgi:hypothetical protein